MKLIAKLGLLLAVLLGSLNFVGVPTAEAMRVNGGNVGSCSARTVYSPAVWNGTGWLEGVSSCWFAGPSVYSYNMVQNHYSGGTVHTAIDAHSSAGNHGNVWNSWNVDAIGVAVLAIGQLMIGPNVAQSGYEYGDPGYKVWDPTVTYPTYTWASLSQRQAVDRVYALNGGTWRMFQGSSGTTPAPHDNTGILNYNGGWVSKYGPYITSPLFTDAGSLYYFA